MTLSLYLFLLWQVGQYVLNISVFIVVDIAVFNLPVFIVVGGQYLMTLSLIYLFLLL